MTADKFCFCLLARINFLPTTVSIRTRIRSLFSFVDRRKQIPLLPWSCMTSASVLFYGNRRSRASRCSDELGLGSSSSSDRNPSFDYLHNSTNGNSAGGIRNNTHHRPSNRVSSQFHRRHSPVDDHCQFRRRSSHIPHLCIRASSSEYEAIQRDHGISESPSGNTSNNDPQRPVNTRISGANRLPGAVVLAKERLVQRLRGVSVLGARQSRRTTSDVAERPDFWLVDAADWESSILTEQSGHNLLSGQHSHVHGQRGSQPRTKKPPGLDKEMLACLNHEIFIADRRSDSEQMSNASRDCSICLESFIEGNRLTCLPCGHIFHSCCLYPWVQICGECPYCRTSIVVAARGGMEGK